MASSEVFQWVCGQLEASTSFSDLEARGTVRIAIKKAGLDPNSITADEMAVVVRRVLPDELSSRDVEDAPGCCEQIAAHLGSQDFTASETAADSPEAIFARLGGDS